MSDEELIARLRKGWHTGIKAADRIEALTKERDEADDLWSARVSALTDAIAALTEQLAAARQDAKEAEVYAGEMEREQKGWQEAAVKLMNKLTASEAKLATCEKYRDAYAECDRIGAQAVRGLEAKLAKAVEGLEWQASQPEAQPFMAQHARATLAAVKGEKHE